MPLEVSFVVLYTYCVPTLDNFEFDKCLVTNWLKEHASFANSFKTKTKQKTCF